MLLCNSGFDSILSTLRPTDMEWHLSVSLVASLVHMSTYFTLQAILVAKKSMGIEFSDPSLQSTAQELLNHSQVCDAALTSKDILNSEYLACEEMITHVQMLWNDNGVHKAYSRSNEYQLLDCAA